MVNKFETQSFLNGANAAFIEDLYADFLSDPGSVDASWHDFFGALGDDPGAVQRKNGGASWGRKRTFDFSDEPVQKVGEKVAKPDGASGAEFRAAALDIIRARMLIRAYRVRGHLGANLDPLGLAGGEPHPELDPAYYGFAETDYDRPIFLDNSLGKEQMTVREILDFLRRTYSSTIGYEFMHIQVPEQRAWLQVRIEDPERLLLDV